MTHSEVNRPAVWTTVQIVSTYKIDSKILKNSFSFTFRHCDWTVSLCLCAFLWVGCVNKPLDELQKSTAKVIVLNRKSIVIVTRRQCAPATQSENCRGSNCPNQNWPHKRFLIIAQSTFPYRNNRRSTTVDCRNSFTTVASQFIAVVFVLLVEWWSPFGGCDDIGLSIFLARWREMDKQWLNSGQSWNRSEHQQAK